MLAKTPAWPNFSNGLTAAFSAMCTLTTSTMPGHRRPCTTDQTLMKFELCTMQQPTASGLILVWVTVSSGGFVLMTRVIDT